MQVAEMIVTSREAAQALRDISILPYFVTPQSPSDVARDAKLPANLVHHYANRALELGLLFEERREGGKVFYQLAAHTFKHARDLLDVGQVEVADLELLSEAFVKAYLRSDHIAGHLDPEYAIYGFGDARGPSKPANVKPEFTGYESPEARPAHFHTRTLRLSPAKYKAIAEQVSKILLEAEMDSKLESDVCSFAFLAFDGPMREGHSDSQTINSYLALPN